MKIKHLLLLIGLGLIAMLIGCVPKSQLKKQYELGRHDGQIEAIRGCADEVYRLRADLKKKNEAGNITQPGKKWTGDSWENDVDGSETWQK